MATDDTTAELRFGTCGWGSDDAPGAFYPSGLKAAERLSFYAQYFRAVEIDSTFYGPPEPRVAGHWLDRTPDDFAFTCKVPREITHVRRLREGAEPWREFLRALAPLRTKLRAVLLQLPPSFTVEHDEAALKECLTALPSDFRFAVEFRHASWNLPRIVHLLEEHRVCWVWSDLSAPDEQNAPPFGFLPQTTDFLYLRLMGDVRTRFDAAGAPVHRYGSLLWPRAAGLESWALRLRKHFGESAEAFLFANHHYEGFAPATCQRLARHFGRELALPAPENAGEEPTAEQLELI